MRSGWLKHYIDVWKWFIFTSGINILVFVKGPAKIIYHFNTFPTVTLYS
jgi:hypothetical protein